MARIVARVESRAAARGGLPDNIGVPALAIGIAATIVSHAIGSELIAPRGAVRCWTDTGSWWGSLCVPNIRFARNGYFGD
jgi:hypothetical protein